MTSKTAPRPAGSAEDEIDREGLAPLVRAMFSGDGAFEATVAMIDLLDQQAEHDAGERPLLIDYPEAARLLGLTVPALQQRVSRGQIPSRCLLRTGTRVQFWHSKLSEIRSSGPRPKRKTER